MKKWRFLAILSVISGHAWGQLTEQVSQNVIQTIYVQPVRTPPPPPVAVVNFVAKPTASQFDELQKAIAGTNALRAEKGLPALQYDENLAAYAQFRASEIEQKFSHERPNGEMYRASMSIGRAVGENIAAGKVTAEETVLQFRNSPKHYATILHDKFTKIGMGVVHLPDSKYKYYWVQIFGADNTSSAYAFNADTPSKPDVIVQDSTENGQNTHKITAGTGF